MEEKKDVGKNDLYDELAKVLKGEDEPKEEEKPSGASPENPQPEKTDEKPESAELSEEEISKLTPRAQKRIRELADKVKELAEKSAEKKEEAPELPEKPEAKPSQEFKSVKDFLSAVQDEPSRILLEKYFGAIKSEFSQTLAPIEKANAEAKFETEFSKYEKIEGLSDYKNDLKKTFLRNPNQSLKALVGEVITDLQMSKVKPLEKTPSSPNRQGEVNLDDLDKEQLYQKLETMRGQ